MPAFVRFWHGSVGFGLAKTHQFLAANDKTNYPRCFKQRGTTGPSAPIRRTKQKLQADVGTKDRCGYQMTLPRCNVSAFKTRYYLKLDEGIRRLPKTFLSWQSNHVFLQFAGTKQRIIEALYDGGRLDLHGLYIHFDPKGHWDRKRSQFAVVEVVDAVDRIDRAKRMAVVDLPMIIEAKAQRSQHRWQVTDADREAIVADLILTGRRHKGIPILRPVSPT